MSINLTGREGCPHLGASASSLVLDKVLDALDESRENLQDAKNIKDETAKIKDAAGEAKSVAVSAKDAAESANQNAQVAKSDAQAAKNDAETAKREALEAKCVAENARDGAQTAKNDAITARDEARVARDVAKQYSGKPAKSIDGTWWIWNAETGKYEDSGASSVLSIQHSYPSIEAMNADFSNTAKNDMAIISASVEEEDTAKLYINNGTEWIYLCDLSGVQGATGDAATVTVGTVTVGAAGSDPSVTNVGTSAAAVLNFVIPKGDKGDPGDKGDTGAGISSIVLTSGNHAPGALDTYTVQLTNGETFDFQVYNGADGPKGDDGDAGKSAYQQAVEGGYTGTEAEFGEMLASGPWLPTAGGNVNYISIQNEGGLGLEASATEPYLVIASKVGPGIISPSRAPLGVGNPTKNDHAATKQYVDDAVASSGGGSSVIQGNSVVIGPDAYGDQASNSIVIGNTAIGCFGSPAVIVIGYHAAGSGDSSITIGDRASAARSSSIAIGSYATTGSFGYNAIAMGLNARADSYDGICIGPESKTLENYSIAIGSHASGCYEGSVALGSYATAGAMYSTALGPYAECYGMCSTAIGVNAYVDIAPGKIKLGSSMLSTLECAVSLTITSDERDKINVEPVTSGAIQFLEKITPISYYRNPRSYYIDLEHLSEEKKENRMRFGLCEYDREAHAAGEKKGSRKRIGVSAQQVQEALVAVYGDASYANLVNDNLYDIDPETIPDGVENQLTVNYEGFIPFLIKAVQELSARVKELEEVQQ